jgi:hypothetical protein
MSFVALENTSVQVSFNILFNISVSSFEDIFLANVSGVSSIFKSAHFSFSFDIVG